MKINFYHYESDDITIDIQAHLNDGKLSLEGYDFGPNVEKWWGKGRDYEYSISLDKENTNKLFQKLEISNGSDEEKLNKIKELFSKDEGVSGLNEYCKKHGIETKFFSWASKG